MARNRAQRNRIIAEYQHKLTVALEYQQETAHLREVAGVKQATQRRADAKTAVASARDEISTIPAFTRQGLLIKAEAMKADPYFEDMKEVGGLFSEMARFVDATIAVSDGGAGS